MGRLVTESGMLQEASTEEAKAWNASASRIWMVKPTCQSQISRYTDVHQSQISSWMLCGLIKVSYLYIYGEAHLLVRHVQVHVHGRVVHCVVGDLKNT